VTDSSLALAVPENKKDRFSVTCTVVLSLALFSRLLAMWLIPVTDTTEARYAEIARKMLETGDWITPQDDYGVPFWAKPPLSTWLSAISMQWVGVSEFSARIPSLFFAVLILLLCYRFAKDSLDGKTALFSIVVLATSGLFFVAAGAVMTDEAFLFAIVLVMVAFWYAMIENNRRWGYALFAGFGIGLLAKGPLIFVLTGLPIIAWMIGSRIKPSQLSQLPWFGGSALMLLIGVPWYLLAEHKTPGFLQYFIVGEHIKRYLEPGWNGDLYGHAHMKPLGMIWLYTLVAGFPWAFLAPISWLRNRRRLPSAEIVFKGDSTHRENRGHLNRFILCWFLLPTIFFTFARNILPTYPLYVMPALAIWIAKVMLPDGRVEQNINLRRPLWGVAMPLCCLILIVIYLFYPDNTLTPVKGMIRQIQKIDPHLEKELLYVGKRLYSMEFYHAGHTKQLESVGETLVVGEHQRRNYLALEKFQVDRLTREQRAQLEEVAATSLYTIYLIL